MKEKSIDDFIIVKLIDQQNFLLEADNKFEINTEDNLFLHQTLKKFKPDLWILCPIFGYTNKGFFNVKINKQYLVGIKKDNQIFYKNLRQILLSTNQKNYKNKKITGVAYISVKSILKRYNSPLRGGGGMDGCQIETDPEQLPKVDTDIPVSKILFTETETFTIFNVAFVNIFKNLDQKFLRMFKNTSKLNKKLVQIFITTKKINITFTFPKEIDDLQIVKSSIEDICEQFDKKPSECNMIVNCEYLIHGKGISCTPEIEIIEEIKNSGVIILGKIIFSQTDYRLPVESYINVLEKTLEPFIFAKSLELDFSKISIHPAVQEKLVEFLKTMTQLTNLSLSNISLSYDDLQFLLDKEISYFSINNVKIYKPWQLGQPQPTTVTYKEISELLKTLSDLKISNSDQFLDAMKELDNLNNFTSLDFSDHIFDISLIEKINDALVDETDQTKVPKLTSLNLSNNGMTKNISFLENKVPDYLNKIVKLFRTLDTVVKLDISKNGIISSYIDYIISEGMLPSLKSLNVSDNELNLQNIRDLISKLPYLNYLNISNNYLSEEDKDKLKEYFKDYPSLVVTY